LVFIFKCRGFIGLRLTLLHLLKPFFMEQVAHRIAAMASSQTLAMSQKSKDLAAQGIDVIDLSVGEPDFFTPDHVKEAAKQAIDENYSFYSPVPGYRDLREAIAEKMRKENGLEYQADQIVVSGGAKHSLTNALLCLVNPGEEVIILSPYWVSYVELVKLAGGVPVIVQGSLERDYKVTADQISRAMTERTRAILINSPCNPTGSVYSRDELSEIARVVASRPDVFVISDEIYEYINFEGEHIPMARFGEIFDRVVTINGVSKGYAMTGWRIGYLAAPLWIAKACIKLQGQMTSGASSIAQRAALAAIRSGKDYALKMKKEFRKRRDLVVGGLKEISGIEVNLPRGAFYVFPDVSALYGKSAGSKTVKNDTDLAMYLLEEAHVSVVPGGAFGMPSCIRLSYATSEEKLTEALQRIDRAVSVIE